MVYLDDRLKDFPARIEIVDEKDQRLVFVVLEKVPMTDTNANELNVRRIKNDDTVTIEYIKDRKNHKIVKSIKVSR